MKAYTREGRIAGLEARLTAEFASRLANLAANVDGLTLADVAWITMTMPADDDRLTCGDPEGEPS